MDALYAMVTHREFNFLCDRSLTGIAHRGPNLTAPRGEVTFPQLAPARYVRISSTQTFAWAAGCDHAHLAFWALRSRGRSW
jgi:hypothetical protein